MSKYLKFPTVLFVILFCNSQLHAAPLKTLSLDFERKITENKTTERISGTLHYQVKTGRVVVEVLKPLKQIMVVEKNVLNIYYPVEKQAFRFVSNGRIPLPFIESIIQTTQAEYGLTAIGYSLDKHNVVDKVLYTYWKPPEKAKDTLGVVILGMRADHLISAEIKNPAGYIVGRTLYSDHNKIGNKFIPMKVDSNTYGSKAKVIRHEQVIYSNPKVNVVPPNPIFNFTIPDSIKIKEVKW